MYLRDRSIKDGRGNRVKGTGIRKERPVDTAV